MGVLKLKENVQMVKDTLLELRESTFLSCFPDVLIDQLAPFGELMEAPSRHTLLQEGAPNGILYFLLKGELDVFVEGELVSRLTRRGDIIGEISLTSAIMSSATVTTFTECELLAFSHQTIRQLAEVDGEPYGVIIYKWFSQHLAQKLLNTNQKAKKFEVANRKLTKLHQEFDEINRKKLEELVQHKYASFKAIHDLCESELQALFEGLASIRELNPRKIAEIHGQVESIQDTLRPFAETYSKEKALQNKRVLLAEPDRRQQQIAGMALRGTSISLDVASTDEEIDRLLGQNHYDIVMFSSEMMTVARKAYAKNDKVSLILVTSENTSTYVHHFNEHPYLTNVVSRNLEDRTFTIKNIFATIGKLANDDIFGMNKYLAWGVSVQAKGVQHSGQRPELLETMVAYFGRLGIRESVIERCRTVAEEMLMNAIYDAPMDGVGKALYNHLDRTVDVKLKKKEQATFSYACDGVLAAVSVLDPFGSLQKETLIHYLDRCYSGKDREFHVGKGGGGLGIHIIVETSDLAVFNIQRGVQTEVIALFNVDKKMADQIKNPSFHLFYR